MQARDIYIELEPSAASNAPVPKGRVEASAAPESADITVNFDQLSIPAFIQVVYGSILKRNIALDPTVAARTDLVTFRTSRPLTASRMAELTKQLLATYGLQVQDFEGLVRIAPANTVSSAAPLVRRGRALPDTPAQFRPMFQYVELEAAISIALAGTLRTIFGSRLTITDETNRNALMLSGPIEEIAAALEIIQAMDQPSMRASNVRMIRPQYWGADEFSKRLTEVLVAQGVYASGNVSVGAPVLLVPVPPLNSVVVFANSPRMMELVSQWGRELDQPSTSSAGSSLFSYQVKHADASDLAKVLGDLLGANVSGASPSTASGSSTSTPAPASGQRQAAPSSTVPGPSTTRIVVNPATNSLIIQGGKPEDYRQITALMAELDRPTRSALIEVTVAEVRLAGAERFGVEWVIDQFKRAGVALPTTGLVGGSGSTAVAGTLGRLNIGGSGLALEFRNDARGLQSLLTMLSNTNRSRVLSNPKVMARNGESATIQVGSEVPVITAQTSNPNGFGSSTQNTVQYRSTGTILRVRPVIHSNQRLDLEVEQEVSVAVATETGVTSSPTINTRRVSTRMPLRDGSTVMLGGLISNTNSDSESGVPGARDVPLLGNLFKSRSDTSERTELIILITPYIINDEFEAEAITEAFRGTLGSWARDLLPNKPQQRPEELLPVAPTKPATPGASVTADPIAPDASPVMSKGLTKPPDSTPAIAPSDRATPPKPSSSSQVVPVRPSAQVEQPAASRALTGPARDPEAQTSRAAASSPKRSASAARPASGVPSAARPVASEARAAASAAPPPRGTTPIQDPRVLEELRRKLGL